MEPSGVVVRPETPADADAVRRVVAAAFGRDAEADLVARLHARSEARIALVAVRHGTIVGHVLASPVTIEDASSSRAKAPCADSLCADALCADAPCADAPCADALCACDGSLLGIAPLSVRPADQGRGIGAYLMREVIDDARAAGMRALFLLGHPGYYPRFGFVRTHLGNEYGATDAFMHLELEVGCLNGVDGVVRYCGAFAESST